DKLKVWEEYYNKQRSHSALQGKTPWERYKELENKIPSLDEIQVNYELNQESFVIQNYKYDQAIRALKKK
ncbi:hypothetical protein NF27_CA00010, partial [Candidatus Jidaibacter acanthamoeba]